VRYELGFYIPEDDILHSHRRENPKSHMDELSLISPRCYALDSELRGTRARFNNDVYRRQLLLRSVILENTVRLVLASARCVEN
jgi:hypothetical protein